MNRSLNIVILLIVTGYTCILADDVAGNKTILTSDGEDDMTNGQDNLISSNITVTETEREIYEIMTAADLPGQDGADEDVFEGRTVAINRLQFMLLPVMYKFGVMTTLLVILVITSMKTMIIGVILLVAKAVSFLAKFHHHPPMEKHHIEPHWAPPPPIYWPQPQPHPHPPPQPVHVHMHHDEHEDDLHDHDHDHDHDHYDHHEHHYDDHNHHYDDHNHDHHHDGYDRRDHKIRNRISSALSSPNNKWKNEQAYNPIAIMLENGQFVINKGYSPP